MPRRIFKPLVGCLIVLSLTLVGSGQKNPKTEIDSKFILPTRNCLNLQIWLAPMTRTLKQFPNIKMVDYAINGKIIKDWDT